MSLLFETCHDSIVMVTITPTMTTTVGITAAPAFEEPMIIDVDQSVNFADKTAVSPDAVTFFAIDDSSLNSAECLGWTIRPQSGVLSNYEYIIIGWVPAINQLTGDIDHFELTTKRKEFS